MEKNNKKSNIILYIILIILVASNIVTFKLYLDAVSPEETVLESETNDEIERVTNFIKDWYNELKSEYNEPIIYKNELQFQNGLYTLTYVGNRLRATYPVKGERTIKFDYIHYLEFNEDENNNIICKICYNGIEVKNIQIN